MVSGLMLCPLTTSWCPGGFCEHDLTVGNVPVMSHVSMHGQFVSTAALPRYLHVVSLAAAVCTRTLLAVPLRSQVVTVGQAHPV